MNRMEQLSDGSARAEMVRGGTAVGRHADAEGGADGQAFQALLRDLAQPAPGKDRREPVAADDGPAASPEDGEDGATQGRDDRPTDMAAGEVLADVARLLFAGSAAERERPSGDQAPATGRREAEVAEPRREVAAEPTRPPKTRVLTRETHFEPVHRQPASNPPGTAADVSDQTGATSKDEAGATAVPATTGRAPGGVHADGTATEAPLPASDVGRGSASGTPLRATGSQQVSDRSPAVAVAVARQNGTSADVPVFPDRPLRTAAASFGTAPGRGSPELPAPRDAAPTDTQDEGAGGDRPPDSEPDRVVGDERRHAPQAEASGLGSRTGGSSNTGDRSGTSSPTATTADPAMPAASTSTLPTSTLQRLAGAIAVEAGALAASQSPLGQTLGGSRPATGGPVKILVLRLQPETLGTVTVRLRLVGNALELQVRAASAETAELLERDRGALEECLKASGYDTDLSTIQAAPRDATRPPAGPTGSQASLGRQEPPVASGFRQGDGEQPQGRGGDGGDRPRRPAVNIHTREVNDEARGHGDRPGGLYL